SASSPALLTIAGFGCLTGRAKPAIGFKNENCWRNVNSTNGLLEEWRDAPLFQKPDFACASRT
ncbi:MAG TPA: hypothetical protein V6C78_26300, partial [Crinalium sp.]